ncbi:DUF6270 domain-containing protein [Aestuariimicrobium kwangyangense]|uniref:DUF6270 domain-containing protein n=1 Tax=Aestuariimicrobium kwangyangense TaxID=396389 RepID=UPI0012FAE871|nr:DUF6270 domain-containing protein [Aestuariimicrobium kwangyangense]
MSTPLKGTGTGMANSGLPAASDYGRWGEAPAAWDSLKSFGEAAQWRPGVHVIWLSPATHLDVLVVGDLHEAAADRAVPVFLSGAVTGRNGASGPFFSGLGVMSEVGGPYLCLSDPTLDHDSELALGWYTGLPGEGVREAMAHFLAAVHTRLGRELLLVGGSGGGFAALSLAEVTSVPTSVFVWNPQTDILRYSPGPVLDYLSAITGFTTADLRALNDDDRAALLSERGITHAVKARAVAANPHVRRLMYGQNATDWHVGSHFFPWLDDSPLEASGRDSYVRGDTHVALLSEISVGHDPWPKPVIVRVLQVLVRCENNPVPLVDRLKQEGLLPADGLDNLPRRWDAREGLEQDLRAIVWRATDGIRVRATCVSGATQPAGLSALADPAPEGELVTVSLRDGLGVEIGQRQVPAVTPPARLKIFVYGSCVSRDTFAYFDSTVFTLSNYVARQSLVSAFAPAGDPLIDPAKLSSSFQRRMLEWDAESALPRLLSQRAPEVDLLLWDLTDERLGVWLYDDGHVTTSSVDIAPHLPDGLVNRRRIPFGTDEHFSLFRAALHQWRSLLEQCGVLHKAVLLAPPWATQTLPVGVAVEGRGPTAEEANRVMPRYLDLIEEVTGVPVVGRGLSDVRSPTAHRWGVAPFHYDEATHVELARAVLGLHGGLIRERVSSAIDPLALVTRVPPRPPIVEAERRSAVNRGGANIRQVRRQIEVTLSGVPFASVRIDLYRGSERVSAGPWSKEASATIPIDEAGLYRARVHVLDRQGSRIAIASNTLRVSRL